MNLKEKREELLKVKKNLKKLLKEKDDVTEKVKTLTIEDEEFDEIRNRAEELVRVIEDLKKDEEDLEQNIAEEEKKLEQVAEESDKNLTKESKVKSMDYLKTKESIVDFAKILAKGLDGMDTKKAWTEHLQSKGLASGTEDDFFLPQGVVQAITNIDTDDKGIFDTFFHTGMDVFVSAIDETDNTAEIGRAKGHKRGTTKSEQTITPVKKTINADILYKYLTLDKVVLRNQKNTNALVNYVMYELPMRIYKEIARASAIGDGRAPSSNDKITSFEAMTGAGSPYTTTTTVGTASQNLFEDIITTMGTIRKEGRKYGILSHETLTQLRLAKDGNGTYIFKGYDEIASAFGLEKIFTPDWMSINDAPKFIGYVGDSYKTVGDGGLDSYENFLLSQNKEEYLMETYMGGALTDAKSCGVLVYSE